MVWLPSLASIPWLPAWDNKHSTVINKSKWQNMAGCNNVLYNYAWDPQSTRNKSELLKLCCDQQKLFWHLPQSWIGVCGTVRGLSLWMDTKQTCAAFFHYIIMVLSIYFQPVERKTKNFNQLIIPKELQRSLPFKEKPKIEKKRNDPVQSSRIAVIREPQERKVCIIYLQRIWTRCSSQMPDMHSY